jgi:hypothetical protein
MLKHRQHVCLLQVCVPVGVPLFEDARQHIQVHTLTALVLITQSFQERHDLGGSSSHQHCLADVMQQRRQWL